MEHQILMTIGFPLNGNDTMLGFRQQRRREQYGALSPTSLPESWSSKPGRFTIIASRLKETRRGKDDNFDLLIQTSEPLDIEAVKKSSMKVECMCYPNLPKLDFDLSQAEVKARSILIKSLSPGPLFHLYGNSKKGPSCGDIFGSYPPLGMTLIFKTPDSNKKPDPKPDPNETPKPKPDPDPKPQATTLAARVKNNEKHFSRMEIYKAIREVSGSLQIHLLDSDYWAVTKKLWIEILKANKVDRNDYIAERYDCDDFGLSLKVDIKEEYDLNTVAWVIDYSAKHAYSLLIIDNDEQAEAVFFEPQKDRFLKWDEYPRKDGLIIV